MSATAQAVIDAAASASAGAPPAGAAGGPPAGAGGAAAGAAGAGGAPGAAGVPAAGAGAAGAGNDAFYNSFKDDQLKAWAGNKKYASAEDLARAAWSSERMIGAERAGRLVALPNDKLDDKGNVVERDVEGWKALGAKLGVPEKPEAYELGVDPAFPEINTSLAKVLHENAVPARTAKLLASAYNEAIQGAIARQQQEQNAASSAAIEQLKAEWGPKFKENVDHVVKGKAWMEQHAGALGDAKFGELERIMGTGPMMKLWAAIGAGNTEASFVGGGGGTPGNSIADLEAQRDKITADRSSGKISDHEWRSQYQTPAQDGKFDLITKKIIEGYAARNG